MRFLSFRGRAYRPANFDRFLILGPNCIKPKGAAAKTTAKHPSIVIVQCTPMPLYIGRAKRLTAPLAAYLKKV